jgi:hypothetical protein
MVDNEAHYYPARILNLTMGANWKEFRHNLRQLWRFLQFGRSIREDDLKRLEELSAVNLLTPDLSAGLDSQSTDLDNQADVTDPEETSAPVLNVLERASTYRNQGRWKEAEELDVQVMETSLNDYNNRDISKTPPYARCDPLDVSSNSYSFHNNHIEFFKNKNTLDHIVATYTSY